MLSIIQTETKLNKILIRRNILKLRVKNIFSVLYIIFFVSIVLARPSYADSTDSKIIKYLSQELYTSSMNPIAPRLSTFNMLEGTYMPLKSRIEIINEYNNTVFGKNYFTILENSIFIDKLEITDTTAGIRFKGVTRFKCKDKVDSSLTSDDYYFQYVKKGKQWYLNKIYSTSPWDEIFGWNSEEMFNLKKPNINSVKSTKILSVKNNVQVITDKDIALEKQRRSKEMDFWKSFETNTDKETDNQINKIDLRAGRFVNHAYDRAAVVRYLNKWANDYNPDYKRLAFMGIFHIYGDCANFASQALKAGGILTDGTGKYQWGYSSRIPNVQNNTNPRYSWYNAKGLHDYCTNNKGSINEYGLKGERYWLNIKNQYYNQKLQPGDLVFLYKNKKPNHVMIVHSTGSNAGNVGISAHTNARLNVPLAKLGLKISSDNTFLGMYIRGNYGY